MMKNGKASSESAAIELGEEMVNRRLIADVDATRGFAVVDDEADALDGALDPRRRVGLAVVLRVAIRHMPIRSAPNRLPGVQRTGHGRRRKRQQQQQFTQYRRRRC